MDIILSKGRKIKFLVEQGGVRCRLSQSLSRGIILGYVETNELVRRVDTCIEDAKKSWLDSSDKVTRFHLGYGTYLTITEIKNRIFCDVRRWWLPPMSEEAVPSKTGVVLTAADVDAIAKLQSEIRLLFISEVGDCGCLLKTPCRRCRPFHTEE